MKDVTGKEISLGDKIVFMYRYNHSSEMRTGVVIGFSPKMVRIEYQNKWNPLEIEKSSYSPHNIVITDKVTQP
jgi:hypothetical protein